MSESNGMQVDFFSDGIEIRNVFFVNRPVSINEAYRLDSGNAEGYAPEFPLSVTRKYIEFDQGDSSEFQLNPADELSEAMEDYCLSKAMDEARETPLLSRDDALASVSQIPGCLASS